MYSIKYLIGVTTLLYCLSCEGGGSETHIGVLPLELSSEAQSRDCRFIDDFYSDYGVVDPPYVYGFRSKERHKSAAFWCKEISGNYKLVFVEKGTLTAFRDFSECKSALVTPILWGGLSLKTQQIVLSDFYYYPKFEKKGSKTRTY